MEEIKCPSCGKYKLPQDFHKHNGHINGLQTYCKPCNMEHKNTSRGKLHIKLIAILGGECSKCGTKDKRVLQIDHVNGGGRQEIIKFKDIRKLYSYYLNHPIEAKQKLQVLCANDNWIKRYENNERGGKKMFEEVIMI